MSQAFIENSNIEGIGEGTSSSSEADQIQVFTISREGTIRTTIPLPDEADIYHPLILTREEAIAGGMLPLQVQQRSEKTADENWPRTLDKLLVSDDIVASGGSLTLNEFGESYEDRPQSPSPIPTQSDGGAGLPPQPPTEIPPDDTPDEDPESERRAQKEGEARIRAEQAERRKAEREEKARLKKEQARQREYYRYCERFDRSPLADDYIVRMLTPEEYWAKKDASKPAPKSGSSSQVTPGGDPSTPSATNPSTPTPNKAGGSGGTPINPVDTGVAPYDDDGGNDGNSNDGQPRNGAAVPDSGDNTPVNPKSVYNLADLLALPELVNRDLLDKFLLKSGVGFFVGAPDAGKSMFCRELALAIISGKEEFIGLKLTPEHRQAIYVSTEDNEWNTNFVLRRMLKKYGLLTAEQQSRLNFIFAGDQTTDEVLVKLNDMLRITRADLIVLDGYGDLFNRKDGNSNIEVRQFLKPFSAIAERHDCLVLFVHHINKAGYDDIPKQMHIQGASATAQKARVVGYLGKPRTIVGATDGSQSKRYALVIKGNSAPRDYKDYAIELQFDEETFTFTATGTKIPAHMLGGQDETEAGIYSLFAEGETCVAPDYLISRAAKRGLRGVTKRKLNEVLIKCEGLDAYKNPLWADDGLPALLNALSAASSQTNASDTPLAAPQTDDSSSDNGGPASQVGA